MIDKLGEWVREKLEEGVPEEKIREALLDEGYSREEIDREVREIREDQSSSGFWQYFGREVIRFEKSKLILPIIALLIIAVFAGGVHHLRAEDVDRKMAGNLSQVLYWSLAGVSFQAFNRTEEVNRTIDRYHNRSDRARSQFNSLRRSYFGFSNNLGVPLKPDSLALGSGLAIYTTNLFPLHPPIRPPIVGSDRSYTYIGYKAGILSLPTSNYVLSKEVWTETANLVYREDLLKNLTDRTNKSPGEWTVEEVDREVKEISQQSLEENHMKYLKQRSEKEENEIKEVVQHLNLEGYAPKKLVEVQWYHFLPAAIMAFILYYLVNGLLLVLYRESWNRTRYSVRVAGLTVALFGLITMPASLILSVLNIIVGLLTFRRFEKVYLLCSVLAAVNVVYFFSIAGIYSLFVLLFMFPVAIASYMEWHKG